MKRESSPGSPSAGAPDDARGDRIEAHPFLKWAGGKAAIARRIEELLPRDARDRVYREPFLGGGAMFFRLQPRQAFLSDALAPLIAAYEVVQTSVEALIHRLEELRASHSTPQFYAIRDRFNAEPGASPVERAAWLIYLNKTCYNGLFRTNKSGEFNVPAGRFTNPGIATPTRIRNAAAVLARAELSCAPFDHLRDAARPGDLVYLDPPYVPTSKTASFSPYADGGFTEADQQRLASLFRELDARGCLLALSNSDTQLVRELYAGFDFTPIIAPRAISSKITTRNAVSELLIRNSACVKAARAR